MTRSENRRRRPRCGRRIAPSPSDLIILTRIAPKLVQIRQERDLATAQLDLAGETLHQLVFEVQEQLRYKPGMQKLRENLLRKAIPGLEQIARSGRAIPGVQSLVLLAIVGAVLLIRPQGLLGAATLRAEAAS